MLTTMQANRNPAKITAVQLAFKRAVGHRSGLKGHNGPGAGFHFEREMGVVVRAFAHLVRANGLREVEFRRAVYGRAGLLKLHSEVEAIAGRDPFTSDAYARLSRAGGEDEKQAGDDVAHSSDEFGCALSIHPPAIVPSNPAPTCCR